MLNQTEQNPTKKTQEIKGSGVYESQWIEVSF